MKFEKINNPEFSVTFSKDEGWTILAALGDFCDNHPHAVKVEEWKKWVYELNNLLSRA